MADRQRSSRPGPHRLPADVVAFDQRERLMAAMATAVHERGYGKTTITDVVTTAAIARPTFYEHFADKEACFLATYDALDKHLRTRMEAAFATQAEWPDQVAAALVEMVGFFAHNPEAARVCLVDVATVGPAISERVDDSLEWMISLLASQRPATAGGGAKAIDEPVVVGTFTMLGWRLDAGAGDLQDMAGEVVESVLGPYIGFEQAREVAAKHAGSGN